MSHFTDFTTGYFHTHFLCLGRVSSLILINLLSWEKLPFFRLKYSKFRFPARSFTECVSAHVLSWCFRTIFLPGNRTGIPNITAFSYLLVAGEYKYSPRSFWPGWGRPQRRWLHAWTSDSILRSHEHQRTTSRRPRVGYAWKIQSSREFLARISALWFYRRKIFKF